MWFTINIPILLLGLDTVSYAKQQALTTVIQKIILLTPHMQKRRMVNQQ
jgi:hypothetical protein